MKTEIYIGLACFVCYVLGCMMGFVTGRLSAHNDKLREANKVLNKHLGVKDKEN